MVSLIKMVIHIFLAIDLISGWRPLFFQSLHLSLAVCFSLPLHNSSSLFLPCLLVSSKRNLLVKDYQFSVPWPKTRVHGPAEAVSGSSNSQEDFYFALFLVFSHRDLVPVRKSPCGKWHPGSWQTFPVPGK